MLYATGMGINQISHIGRIDNSKIVKGIGCGIGNHHHIRHHKYQSMLDALSHQRCISLIHQSLIIGGILVHQVLMFEFWIFLGHRILVKVLGRISALVDFIEVKPNLFPAKFHKRF